MANITSKWENYTFGNTVRERLTGVTGTGMRIGNPTKRLIAKAAPQPLSQYPLGDNTPGYRLTHTERGHIVGLQFGGPESKFNLVPMYAGFNGGSGAWGRFESKLANWLNTRGTRSLGITVSIGYDSPDSAIPHSFGLTVHSECNEILPFDQFGGFNFHIHPPAYIDFQELDEDDLSRLDILKRYQRQMMVEQWFVERSGMIAISGSGRSMRSGPKYIPVSVGGIDLTKFKLDTRAGLWAAYASRPYAVLDYLWFMHKSVYTDHLGFAPVTTFDNTQVFSAGQKNAIRKVNILAHLGYMVSDLSRIIPEVEPYHTIYVGSADASGQVDHITGKAGSGSNCYSNARLVSKVMNLALNRQGMQDRANRIYENPNNWLDLAKWLNEFWCGLD